MLIPTRRSCALCGAALFLFAGCYTYHPYGAGRFPGLYSTPPGTYAPGGVPGGTLQPRGGTLGQPGTLPNKGGSDLQAPKSNSNGSTTSRDGRPRVEANRESGTFTNEEPVPKYADPNDVNSGGTGTSGNSGSGNKENVSPFGNGASAAQPAGSGIRLVENSANNATQVERTGDAFTVRSASGFTAPRTIDPDPDARRIAPNGQTASQLPLPGERAGVRGIQHTPNPYEYDTKNYSWLRGKVDYDEGTKTWQIIYSLNPVDEYGGSLTLIDDPSLKRLRNDDVVLVEGRIDVNSASGKPRYRITRLFGPLVPKSKTQPAGEPGGSSPRFGPAFSANSAGKPTGG